jgi:outer membrane lipopolysaccharide assembly protein LptE/RlpB
MSLRKVFLLLALIVLLHACGYELVKGPGLSGPAFSGPEGTGGTITSLSLPVFKNQTFEPQVPQFFTEAFSQELAASGLVQLNKPNPDGVLQGTVTSVSATLAAMNGQGLAVSKVVTAAVTVTLAREGKVMKTWGFGDSETYDASSINTEDFNKRAALVRIAERMARRFHALLISGY